MKPPILLCLIHYTIFLASCSGIHSDSLDKKNAGNSIRVPIKGFSSSFDTTIGKGILHSNIKCSADSSVSYALYIPKNYSPDKKFPVIYFFDPHGNGSFPIKKYKSLAEKYEYIFAGSNNSRNGTTWDNIHKSIKIFFEDIRKKFNIDSRRIYTCGFSGGSRVASSVAIFDGGINCVIGMGAGLPSLNAPIRTRFDYIGFAGNEDFNMNELVALDSSLNNSPIRHQLIIFNGKHEWAPAEIAEDAFVWIEFSAMKDGLIQIAPNDYMIKNFIAINESKIKIFKQNKNIYAEFLSYKKILNYLYGLTDVSLYKKKTEELNNSDDLKKIITKKAELAKKELKLQESYRNNFVMKDLLWWTNEIKNLQPPPTPGGATGRQANPIQSGKSSPIIFGNGSEDAILMNKRLLSYLSLVAYMQASSALQSNQLELAENFLKVYLMVDPANPEHQYLFATLYARKKDNLKAINYLKNAVKLGFNDISRIQSDSSLSVLKNYSEYKQLIEKLK